MPTQILVSTPTDYFERILIQPREYNLDCDESMELYEFIDDYVADFHRVGDSAIIRLNDHRDKYRVSDKIQRLGYRTSYISRNCVAELLSGSKTLEQVSAF